MASRRKPKSTDEDALIERATQIIGGELYPDNFGVLLLDPAAGVLRMHLAYQGVTDVQRRRTIALGLGLTGAVTVDGQPRRSPDVSLAPGYLEITPGTRSELCVPLKVADRILGVVNAGTGLGLSICKEIVEQHGGSLAVHSSEAEGTTFTVWLPVV